MRTPFEASKLAHKECRVCPNIDSKGPYVTEADEVGKFLVICDTMEDRRAACEVFDDHGIGSLCAYSLATRCTFVAEHDRIEANNTCQVWTKMLLHATNVHTIIISDIAMAQIDAKDKLIPFGTKVHPAYGLISYIPFNRLESREATALISELKETTK